MKPDKAVLVFNKLAGIGDWLRKSTGYHDTRKLSEMTGIDKERVTGHYHKLRVPNAMLYSYEDAAKDIKSIDKKWTHYAALQSGLRKTKPGSKEEKAFLKKNKMELDKRYADYAALGQSLSRKYYNIKNK